MLQLVGFENFDVFPPNGGKAGLIFAWCSGVVFFVVARISTFILVIISFDPPCLSWMLTFVYYIVHRIGMENVNSGVIWPPWVLFLVCGAHVWEIPQYFLIANTSMAIDFLGHSPIFSNSKHTLAS